MAAIEHRTMQMEPLARWIQPQVIEVCLHSGENMSNRGPNLHDSAQESVARNVHGPRRVETLVSTTNGASVPIIVDRLILSCAEFLVDIYGENEAMCVASRRFDLYAVKPDLIRCAVWQQIMCALWELRRAERAHDEQLH